MTSLRKIISGGQTGADQGALIAAREMGITTGGIAPLGWLTEEGPREELLASFGLVECSETGYAARTRENVAAGDGTLVVGQHEKGGSRLTVDVCRELKKPVFFLARDADATREFREWIDANSIVVLNVAGDRESDSPGIGAFTRDFLVRALGGERETK